MRRQKRIADLVYGPSIWQKGLCLFRRKVLLRIFLRHVLRQRGEFLCRGKDRKTSELCIFSCRHFQQRIVCPSPVAGLFWSDSRLQQIFEWRRTQIAEIMRLASFTGGGSIPSGSVTQLRFFSTNSANCIFFSIFWREASWQGKWKSRRWTCAINKD